MKLSKMFFVVTIAIIAILAMSISVNAYTSAELADYITGAHLIGGNQYKLTDSNAATVKSYLNEYPVTDAQASQIKTLLDQAKAKANSKSDLSQLTDAEKAEIISLLQQAGAVAGLTVNVDTVNNTITVSKGNTILFIGSFVNSGNGGITVSFGAVGGSNSGASSSTVGSASNGGANTFVYTGANNSAFAVVALLAVVAVSTIVVRKVYVK